MLPRVPGTSLRRVRVGAASIAVTVLTVLATAAACDDGEPVQCRVDSECPQGSFCLAEACVVSNADGGLVPADGAVSCSAEGVACVVPEECCSRTCESARCGATTTLPGPSACRGLYELCQNDCCTGLVCRNGACR